MATPTIPTWTLGDRLRKALDEGQLTVDEMAEKLGVTPRTVRNYLTDATPVRRGVLDVWARATGVDLDWLLGDAIRSRCVSSDAQPTLPFEGAVFVGAGPLLGANPLMHVFNSAARAKHDELVRAA